ncbi:MAG: alpha/beta fold hydrolase [Gammaproteobacteria bacterium]|nr:alpha/beta fold hydrolase [Gammaproteobacteria bacterium]
MPSIDRHGVEIYYEVHGQGPAILMSHGYAATCTMWRGQLKALGEDHTLVTWDMRGHGQSGSPSDASEYSARRTVEDMAAILDALGLPCATVGGHSLGGYMSLEFHRVYEERVSGLLIVDTGPGFRSEDSRQAWNRQAHAFADAIARDGKRALSSGLARTARHNSLDGLARAGRHMLTQHDAAVIESLDSIRKPALIIVGAHDKPFLNGSDYMARKIPGARKVVIPDAGHAVNVDQPDEFNRVVSAFLSEHGL